MKCLMCGKESIGALCNACIRTEEVKLSKEWVAKEGLLVKKSEDYKVAISTVRINGRFAICDNTSGMNVRIDSASHYIKHVKGIESVTYNKKETLAIYIENPDTGMKRYLYLPQFEGNKGELESAIKSCQ